MGSELWQFLLVLLVFAVAVVLWLLIVYLPGRTLERWEDQRPGHGKGGPASDPGSPDGPLKPGS